VFSTTNDNLPVWYFCQRRGWTITEIVNGGMLAHLKGNPATGFAGIPVWDEIRLERVLGSEEQLSVLSGQRVTRVPLATGHWPLITGN
jgi:hypothetical protein